MDPITNYALEPRPLGFALTRVAGQADSLRRGTMVGSTMTGFVPTVAPPRIATVRTIAVMIRPTCRFLRGGCGG